MASEFRVTSEEELEAVAKLLQNSFHSPEDSPALNRSLLRWKYYQQGFPMPGSRSYVLADKGAFIAHAAIWPLELRIGGEARSGIGFCDWVASEEQRGAGLLLLKKLTALAPFVLVIGGAEITRQILPRVGFKFWADLPVYVRVLRPFRQSMTRTSAGWKEPARLARNAMWSRSPLHSTTRWTAEYGLPDEKLLAETHEQEGSINSKEFLAFMLRCPTVPIRSLILKKDGAPIGYAVTSVVARQGRLADLRIASRDEADWKAAVSLVVNNFLKEREACELSAIATVPLLRTALESNGFRVREHRPLVVLDSAGDMTTMPVPNLGMLVDDASVLHNPESPYLT